MNKDEIWLPVVGFESKYEVSNKGRVRSIKKDGSFAVRSPYVSNCGYMRLWLYDCGRNKQVYVHRLVAEAFLQNTLNKPQVNHIDCNKANNNLENLEWATREENMKHADINGKMENLHAYTRRKRTPLKSIDVFGEEKVFNSIVDASRELGIEPSGVYKALKGILKTRAGYRFEYVPRKDVL